MAMGLPVLCLAHQGVGDITNDKCAIRIQPVEIDATIQGLAVGIRKFCTDPGLRKRLGHEARERALRDFRWEDKFDLMVRHYEAARASEKRASLGIPAKPSLPV
jgi:glycosyltransferase involved in cell wall biosynthesis